jgi:hypothetical protein
MSVYGENARGLHAVKVFQNQKDFTLDKLIAASYDSELTAFEALLPPLFAAYDALPAGGAQSGAGRQVALLRAWDCAMRWNRPPRWPFWGQELAELVGRQARELGVPRGRLHGHGQGQRRAAPGGPGDGGRQIAARFRQLANPVGRDQSASSA